MGEQGDEMSAKNWRILYTGSQDDPGRIFSLGPFSTEVEAMMDASRAHEEGEFDILDQHVYLLTPQGKLQELGLADLDAGV